MNIVLIVAWISVAMVSIFTKNIIPMLLMIYLMICFSGFGDDGLVNIEIDRAKEEK